jgi:hypothetical protein
MTQKVAVLMALALSLAAAPLLAQAAPPPLKPGEIPLPYPVVGTTAQPGDFVIAPAREFFDRAVAEGINKVGMIYYGAYMEAPGSAESRIKTLTGKIVTLPNSLIVPIRRGEQAAVGDILLGTWQSGSGMQRAIVIAGGTPAAPKVRYLDLDYDNPAGVGQKDDTLKADCFHKQPDGLAVGNVVAVKAPGGHKRLLVVGVSGEKVLGLGFANRLMVAAKADCTPLPLKPAVKAGDKVLIPSMGTFRPATVDNVDTAIGRVFATYEFGGKPKTVAVAFGDVALALP